MEDHTAMHDTYDLRVSRYGRFSWHKAGRSFPYIGGGDGDTPAPTLEIPDDLTGVEDLGTLKTSVAAALDELRDKATQNPDDVTNDDVTRAAQLGDALKRIEGEEKTRASAKADRVKAIMDTPRPTEEAPAEETPAEPVATEPPAGEPPAEPAPETPPAETPAEEQPAEAIAASAGTLRVPAVAKPPTLNPSLTMADIANHQPDQHGISPNPAPSVSRAAPQPVVMTASSEVGRFHAGQNLTTLDDLAEILQTRVNAMAITSGNGSPLPVATIERKFATTLEEGMEAFAIDAALEELINPALGFSGMAALVAAGGWCAPSEIDYSFFNVAGQPTGMVDLPTVGIRRGGLRWPISLTLADFFALSGAPASGIPSNATMPWEWTETDDILAATGSPTKSCLRPPCPTFTEARLRVWGLCVLAGNLTEEAYPELIRHFLMLTTIAHARVMNRRHILLMAGDSSLTAVTPTKGATASAFTHMLGAVDLEAQHLRYKYGAPLTATLELVLPAWVRGLLRSDLSKRNGWSDLSVADAFLTAQFDARNIRVQWVEDWQALPGSAGPANTMGAATPPTAWPSTFTGMMFFPGHFFRGNGLNLNLGALRDSVLNKANDHTAAWSEEGTLIGVRGKEGLLITFSSMWADGNTTVTTTAQSSASA